MSGEDLKRAEPKDQEPFFESSEVEGWQTLWFVIKIAVEVAMPRYIGPSVSSTSG